MGPFVILDKSSIQTLSFDEIVFLNRYYWVNIPPILLTEILADLKKNQESEEAKSEVISLAKKLLQSDSAINMPYERMIEASLVGHDPCLDVGIRN